MNEIAIFETDEDRFEVRLEGETLWTTQAQMAELFDTTTDNIGLYLKNLYAEGELKEAATTEIFSVVRQEGTRRVRPPAPAACNLDTAISAGLIPSYARTWTLLVQYDEQDLPQPAGQPPRSALSGDEAREAVAALKERVIHRRKAGGAIRPGA